MERTGREQRRPGVVHADDVREYLLRSPKIREEFIAVKTSQKDELKNVDEIGGLLSQECPIRFIITKQALQEGWGCPFAYVLTILTNPSSKSTLTQLVGRILRQPYARKTRVSVLDECYVFCFQRRGSQLLKEVRKGFGLEGLHGMEGRIVSDAERAPEAERLATLLQRKEFHAAARDLVLPAFMIKDRRKWRLVHYESDILSRVPWDEVDVSTMSDLALGEERLDDEVRTNLDAEALVADPETQGVTAAASSEIDYYFAASHLLDVMPNPWRGSEVARQVFGAMLRKHSQERVVSNYVFILEELRKRLEAERDRLSQQVFRNMLADETMKFIVVADDRTSRRPMTSFIKSSSSKPRASTSRTRRTLPTSGAYSTSVRSMPPGKIGRISSRPCATRW